MIPLEEILLAFKKEAEIDWIGLWQVAGAVLSAYWDSPPDEIRTQSMVLVRMMLQSGFVAGSFSGNGDDENNRFVPWPDQTPETIVRRLEDEWDRRDRYPDIGDMPWFDLPREKRSG